jgi:uncharacterized protein YbcC (UPF0753/DUF2309 family)
LFHPSPAPTAEPETDNCARILAAIEHLDHVLPGQAPLRDFVHHNTLHGFQHLSFPEALAQAHHLNGAAGYLSQEKFRAYYRQGRIERRDLVQVLDAESALDPDEPLFMTPTGPVLSRDIYLLALLHPLEPIPNNQFAWEIEEMSALERFQADVPPEVRARLLATSALKEKESIADLWSACLERLDLSWYQIHPEELVDLTPERLETMQAALQGEGASDGAHHLLQRRISRLVRDELRALMERVGRDLTLTGLLRLLTGRDVLDEIRPYLIRQLANFLDQGLAAWHVANRGAGFYACWRELARVNPGWRLLGLGDWTHDLDDLPEDPLEAVMAELEHLDLPPDRWPGYLERLALEIPGWSGIWLWRHRHPDYKGWSQPVGMLDYLAVRLILERLYARRLCAEEWGIPPHLGALHQHFGNHPMEFLVRWSLFTGPLPEYLASRAQRLVRSRQDTLEQARPEHWHPLAQLIWAWRWSPAAVRLGRDLFQRAWPLFRLAQHLGMSGAALRDLDPAQLLLIFRCLDRLDEGTAGFIWLRAFENHYRDQILNALVNNQGRGRWHSRSSRPSAQLVFCMDDREEGLRRHLEEVDPGVETLGAAAHFGVSHWWRGLDDGSASALCPVVMTPSHQVREVVQTGAADLLARHRHRRHWRLWLRDLLHQELRRNLISSTLGILLAAPVATLALVGKVAAPRRFGEWAARLRRDFDVRVPTELAATVDAYQGEPSPENVQPGFVTAEQARRVAGLLRVMGLDSGFAPLVVIMGHGSDSDNNPHLAAYDCGACSGNHSGPNARLFAAMANRPETRAQLREQELAIPEDCWFLGAEHNTCNEAIVWYDLERLPIARAGDFQRLEISLGQAVRLHAQERCRKFFSAPAQPTPDQALAHVLGRGLDFSQARPELGHATNACAFIGRRAMSQGVFFDRRAFLISYDATKDPDGTLLEPLLLANGPVGAGISLEYYFSTVDNERYGAGSKITHNVAGFFGVMDGAGSDLRTGLPRQMIEIHEAMRLLVIVEARTRVLTAIHARQPPLQELIDNGWLLLAAKDPDSTALHLFEPGLGWVEWQGPGRPLPRVSRSSVHFMGFMEPLDPILIGD